MTERELRKLSRLDLLELLLNQQRENEQLRCLLDQAEARLADRTIQINKAGSLAEASLQLSGIFAAAQESCQCYIDNIRQLSERQSAICQQMEEETKKNCDRMISEAEFKSQQMEKETKKNCDRMISEAEFKNQKFEAETKERCDQMIATAEFKSQQWEDCHNKIRKLMEALDNL